MAIRQGDLQAAAQRSPLRKSAPAFGQSTAFLSHSHKDRQLAEGLQEMLRQRGMDLYIDWQDASMSDQPTRETAVRLQRRIVDTTWFFFLATANSMSSRWCPW